MHDDVHVWVLYMFNMTLVLSVCTVICIVPKEQCCQPIFRNLHCILILPCIIFISVCFLPIPTKTCRQIFLWGVPLCYMSYCCFYQLFSITVHCILCNNQFVKFIFSYFGSISWLNPTTSSTLTRVTCIWPL